MNKIVAGLGLFVLLVGLAMTVVISIIEDWVRVGIQGLPECDVESDAVKGQPAKLGSLGLYSATFNPDCADGTPIESYAAFNYTESSTTEFWPLFPAQNSYGGLFGKDLEFKDCESFYAEDSPARAAAVEAFYPRVEAGFAGAEAALAAQYTELSQGVFGILGNLDGAVAGLWAGQLEKNGATIVSSLQSRISDLANVLVIVDVLIAGATPQYAGSVQLGTPLALNSPLAAGIYGTIGAPFMTAAPVTVSDLVNNFNMVSFATNGTVIGATACNTAKMIDASLDCTNGTVITEFAANVRSGLGILRVILAEDKSVFQALPGFVAPSTNLYTQPTAPLVGFATALAAGGSTVPVDIKTYLFKNLISTNATLANATIPESFLNADISAIPSFAFAMQYAIHFGVASIIDPASPFTVTRAQVEAVSSSAKETLALLDSAGSLPLLCVSNGKTTLESCKAVFNEVPHADVNDKWTLCEVASASPDLAPAVAGAVSFVSNLIGRPAECSPMVLFKAVELGIQAGAAIDVPATLAPFVPVLVDILTECAASNLTWAVNASTFGSCQNQFVNPSQPAVSNEDYAGVPEEWDARSPYCFAIFQTNPAASCNTFIDVAQLIPDLAPFYGGIMSGCISNSITNTGTCKIILKTDLKNGFSNGVFTQVVSSANSTETLIAACKEDEEDARRIKLAQVLIPAALGVEGVALLLALALIASGKTPLAFVACVLACAGTALSCSALLLVRGAPVYANVGEEVEDGEAKYVGGLANLLGLFAIALPALGGFMLAFSTCCNKEEDEDQLTSKVDATY